MIGKSKAVLLVIGVSTQSSVRDAKQEENDILGQRTLKIFDEKQAQGLLHVIAPDDMCTLKRGSETMVLVSIQKEHRTSISEHTSSRNPRRWQDCLGQDLKRVDRRESRQGEVR